MSKTETMTIRVPSDVRTQLELLAKSTQRTKSYLAAQAISRFVESEAEIVDGIKRGLADIKASRVVPNDEAMRRIRATIANPRELLTKKSV
jgi:predicted transcriptional regulator